MRAGGDYRRTSLVGELRQRGGRKQVGHAVEPDTVGKSTTSAAVSTMQVLDTYTAVLDEVVHVASQADTEEGKETGCIDEPRREFGPRMSWRM